MKTLKMPLRPYIILGFGFLLLIAFLFGCKKSDFPIDEDGLLITTRTETSVSSFNLLGTDHQNVTTKIAVIDTLAGTINAEVFFGTDLKNLYPQFTLATDAKLEPKILGKVDFSDQANPKTYTVVSGDRKHRMPYTIYISVQPQP